MPTALRYEWIKLGKGGFAENVIKQVVAGATTATLTTTPAADIAVPDGHVDGDLYCRLTAIDGVVHVAWAADPAVDLTNGIRLIPNVPEVIAVDSDWALSARSEV